MMTTANTVTAATGECQICGRQLTTAKGRMSKHGFSRPGDGYLHGSCMGAKRVPYAVGTDALVEYAASLTKSLESATAYQVRLQADAPSFINITHEYLKDAKGQCVYVGRKVQLVPVMTEMVCGVSEPRKYAAALVRKRAQVAAEVSALTGELARVNARIAAWK